jgi:predicted alpha/beta hydrolase family esterase
MGNAIILHGMPSKEEYRPEEPQSEQHWLPWLRQKLQQRGIDAHTPELPEPWEPEYGAWKAAFEKLPLSDETILVGHSCGAGFLARWLSENPMRVEKVVLVAPWMDPPPRFLKNGFFEFTLDPNVPERTSSVTIYSSTDDDEDIQKSVEILKDAWPTATHKEYDDKGHFDLEGLGTNEFPELLEELT